MGDAIKKLLSYCFVGVLVAGGLFMAGRAYYHSLIYVSTDNAFIEGNVVALAPKVAGHIVALHVVDNQLIKEGDLICEIDPQDYQISVEQARTGLVSKEAKLRTAEAQLQVIKTQANAGVDEATSAHQSSLSQLEISKDKVKQSQAAVTASKASLENSRALVKVAEAENQRAKADLARLNKLDNRAVSRQQYDLAVSGAASAEAQLDAAHRRVNAAEAALQEAQASEQLAFNSVKQAQSMVGQAKARFTSTTAAPEQIVAAEAEVAQLKADVDTQRAVLKQAEMNLSYTKIVAPQSGRITKRNIDKGSYVVPGQSMLAVVPENLWVVANFKETQLTRMKQGQEVTIKLDTFPDHPLKGKVDSFQAGTGSRFSLMPPENATGNYVKVVQRVPVKIVFSDPVDPNLHLGPGMSVVPFVNVQ